MDTKEIQKRVDALAVAMAEKGLICPEVTFSVNSGSDINLMLKWENEGDKLYDWQYSHHRGGSPIEAINSAINWITDQPTKDERKFKAFMTAVASAVDMGRQNGIDVEFVNPLAETLKKLSENAITDQRVSK